MVLMQRGPSEHDRAAGSGIPTVSRVAGDTLVELVYDADKHETALAVSRFGGLWNIEREVRVGTDHFVPYSPANNLIRTECVLLPSNPEHHGDKSELLAAVESYLRRYLELSPIFLKIAAHYVLLSWVYDSFNELPYLRLQGDFGTGKTRGLIAIGSILYKPFFASGASTVSPIFHILETFGGSLVLDEADFRFSDGANELVKILNNGTMRGLPVLRTMQNQYRELNPRAFRVFGPKIVAMRGSYQDRGLESRFISENMNALTMRRDIPVHLPSDLRIEALALRNRLLHYRFCNLFSIRINPALVSPDAPARFNQLALPLLSIIDDAELRDEIRNLLLHQSDSLPLERDDRAMQLVAKALVEAFDDQGIASISVGELARRVNKGREEGQYATKYIGHILRSGLGIPAHKSNGVFVVTRDTLPEIKTLAKRIRGAVRSDEETADIESS